jgi:hypothetical protein
MTVSGFQDGVCVLAGPPSLNDSNWGDMGEWTDISKVKANKIYPRSFNGVVVHSVCYRVHDRKGKERRSLRGQWVCSRKRMTRRTREGKRWTDRTTPAAEGAKWWW